MGLAACTAVCVPERDRSHLIVHVGFALQKLDPEEAAQTLALFAEIGGVPP